jgi:hypothetical protein
MNNFTKAVVILLLFVLLSMAGAVVSQEDTCVTLVQAALTATNNACAGTSRNQACYGNLSLEAEPHAGVAAFTFEATGDIVDVSAIKTLQLSSMSLTDSAWGVALMKLQANLPDTLPGQNVVLLMFGAVHIDNAVEPLVTLDMTASGGVNVRLRPSTSASVLTSLQHGAAVTATGRLADNSWIRIKSPNDLDGAGWVSARYLQSSGDINTLKVVEASSPVFGPMQSFYFKSGVGDAPCAEAPESGILIQTPKGAGEVSLTANGVEVTLGSTIYLQSQPDDFMTVSVVDGSASLTAAGVRQVVPAGTLSRVPLDGNGIASGPPEFPQPYDRDKLKVLPVSILPDHVAIAPALTETEIRRAIALAEGIPDPGQWRWTYGKPSACNTSYKVDNPKTLIVGDDGALIVIITASGVRNEFQRTAPGVYARAGVPIDYTREGYNNILQRLTLRVVTPIRIVGEQVDYLPAQNCTLIVPVQLDWIGP